MRYVSHLQSIDEEIPNYNIILTRDIRKVMSAHGVHMIQPSNRVLRDFVKSKNIRNKNASKMPTKLKRIPSAKT